MGDYARLEAVEGGEFSVGINVVLTRGNYVGLDRPNLIEVSWGQARNDALPPGSSQLVVTSQPDGQGTLFHLQHSGLAADEAKNILSDGHISCNGLPCTQAVVIPVRIRGRLWHRAREYLPYAKVSQFSQINRKITCRISHALSHRFKSQGV
jgi:hypothetical protein